MREKQHPCDDKFVNRWSPRAFEGEVTEDQVNTLLEASRWAPSAFNEQPWKISYAIKGTPEWDLLFSFLGEFNQAWCKNAGALFVFTASDKFAHNKKPNGTAHYDTGSAWMSLALQAQLIGLAAHGMAGFDYDKAKSELNVPVDHSVLAMAVVGVPADKSTLPKELQEKEVQSNRKNIEEFAVNGKFK